MRSFNIPNKNAHLKLGLEMHDRLPEVDDSGVGHKAGEDRHSGPGWEDLYSNGHRLDFSLGDPQEGSDGFSLCR